MPSKSSPSLSRTALIEAIGAAFRDVVYPGDDRIVSPYEGDLERESIRDTLKGRHWRDVSFDELDKLRTALPLLSPEGFRFYLPAFMIYCASDFYRADVASHNVIRSITLPLVSDFEKRKRGMDDYRTNHPNDRSLPDQVYKDTLGAIEQVYSSGDLEGLVVERISGFSAEQGTAIRRYLEYMASVHGEEFLSDQPRIAIERYWCRF